MPTWSKNLRFTSEDKSVDVKLGGRVHADWAWINGDENQLGTTFPDGNEFRRARLYLSGTIQRNMEFKVQYDFEDGLADFKDVWGGLKDVTGVGRIRVGQQYEPYGLEEQTSSNDITFLERALITTFVPSRQTGILVKNTSCEDRFFWSAGYFQDVNGFGEVSGTDGMGNFTARVAGRPMIRDEGFLHVGLDASYRNTEGNFTVNQGEEINLGQSFAMQTVPDVQDITLAGVEAAYVCGPWSVQGEFHVADFDGVADDPRFYAYYLQTAYTLTGESRGYKAQDAVMGGITPKSSFGGEGDGCGAWEVAARYSLLDLNDGPTFANNEVASYTAGVNWYLNPNARIMFNLNRTKLDGVGEQDAAAVRFQFVF